MLPFGSHQVPLYRGSRQPAKGYPRGCCPSSRRGIRPDGVLRPRAGVPAPCTLHPAPCTLHPAPCTLHPASCTLDPGPWTLDHTADAARMWGEEAGSLFFSEWFSEGLKSSNNHNLDESVRGIDFYLVLQRVLGRNRKVARDFEVTTGADAARMWGEEAGSPAPLVPEGHTHQVPPRPAGGGGGYLVCQEP